MKKQALYTLLVSALQIPVAQACIGDGAVEGVLVNVPKGTFEVAIAMNQAIETNIITPAASSSLNTVQFMLTRQLQQHYQGELIDITLFDSSGMHFVRVLGDGDTLSLSGHEVPKDAYQDVLVTDIDALTQLVRKQISFTQLTDLGLFYQTQATPEFQRLMTNTFG